MDQNVALYRKYRPETFEDVLGQDHITTVLRGSLENSAVSHAYLFFGARGTGKTSVARIMAQELEVSLNDLYEIDAASNRGIDDIRALRESVRTHPFDSPYKVYIIDEVHMLTKEAFNALLKTLEEPPPYVIFILATTEFDKVPETIISRCQTFTFKQPNDLILKELVVRVAKEEGITIAPDAAELIAMLGDGSFRDTLGTLQKVAGFSPDAKLSREEVETVTGAPQRSLVERFVQALVTKDAEAGISAIRDAAEQNIDMSLFLKLVTAEVRLILLLRHAPKEGASYLEGIPEDRVTFIKTLSQEAGVTAELLRKLLAAHEEIQLAFIPQLPLELLVSDFT